MDVNKNDLKNSSGKFPPRNRKKQPNNNNWLFFAVIFFVFLLLASQTENINRISSPQELKYSDFYQMLRDNHQTGKIQKLVLIESTERILKGTLQDGGEFRLHIPQNDDAIPRPASGQAAGGAV